MLCRRLLQATPGKLGTDKEHRILREQAGDLLGSSQPSLPSAFAFALPDLAADYRELDQAASRLLFFSAASAPWVFP